MVFRYLKVAGRKLLARAYEWEIRRRGIQLGEGAYISGRPIITRDTHASMHIGHRLSIESNARAQVIGVIQPVVLRAVGPGAILSIGDDCGISGSTLVATSKIEIGHGCLIGSGALIIDSNLHPVHDSKRRYRERPAPREEDYINIEDNVFIGARAVVLPGTRIGRDSVVAAASVVRGTYGPAVILAGNPARVVGTVKS